APAAGRLSHPGDWRRDPPCARRRSLRGAHLSTGRGDRAGAARMHGGAAGGGGVIVIGGSDGPQLVRAVRDALSVSTSTLYCALILRRHSKRPTIQSMLRALFVSVLILSAARVHAEAP